MGREQSRTRQYLYLCVAGLIAVVLAGCAPLLDSREERKGRAHLQRVQQLIRQDDFTAAVRENREILARDGKKPPADAALLSQGRVFADPDNPEKDYGQARDFLTRLAQDFPASPFAEEAGFWAGVLGDGVWEEWEGRRHLQRMRQLIRAGDFAGALEANRQILDTAPDTPLAEAALLSLGMIFAEPDNPEKDYGQARDFLTRLAQDFPASPFAEEAGFWAGVLGDGVWEEWEGRRHLQRIRQLIRAGDFAGALEASRQILGTAPDTPPADAALLSLGMIFANRNNPEKDYDKALDSVLRLLQDFPASPFAEEGRAWAAVLERRMAGDNVRVHPPQVQYLIDQRDFEGALQEGRKMLALTPKSPPGDRTLFSMGLIHLHFANPKKDYKKALTLFSQLKNDFPASPFVEEAQIWMGLLESMEQALQVDLEIEQKKKELRK